MSKGGALLRNRGRIAAAFRVPLDLILDLGPTWLGEDEPTWHWPRFRSRWYPRRPYNYDTYGT